MFNIRRSISTRGLKNSTSKFKLELCAQTSNTNKNEASILKGLTPKALKHILRYFLNFGQVDFVIRAFMLNF